MVKGSICIIILFRRSSLPLLYSVLNHVQHESGSSIRKKSDGSSDTHGKRKKKNHDVVPRKSLTKNFSQGQFPGKQILYATSTYLAQLVNGLSGLDKTIIDSSERRSLWECIDRTLLKISDVSVIEERLERNGDF